MLNIEFYINHEHFSDIAKDKSCSFIFVGQDVVASMEALYETLWQFGWLPMKIMLPTMSIDFSQTTWSTKRLQSILIKIIS